MISCRVTGPSGSWRPEKTGRLLRLDVPEKPLKGSTGGGPAGVLENLRRSPPLRRFPPRNSTKAEVLVCRHDGRTIALKDYGARPFLVRQTVGRYLIRREAAMYRAAGTLPGLPRCLGRIGPFALATEWIEGSSLSSLGPGQVPPMCFDRLAALVDAIHERGIALGDLHHRDVVVDGQGGVHVVDLALAWISGRGWRRRLFEWLRDQDRIAVARMRARFEGTDERAAIAATGVGRGAVRRYEIARRLRRGLDRLRGRRIR